MDEYSYQPSEAYDGSQPPQMDLFTEQEFLRHRIDDFIEDYRKCGIEHAKADREYHVVKAAKTLELRERGLPVTLIAEIVKGQVEVAEKREQMLVSEVMTRAALEAVLSAKIQVKLVSQALAREWANPQASY